MATIALLRDRNVLARAAGQVNHPKLILTGDQGGRVVVPFGDNDSQHTGYGPTWERVDRGAGRTPLLLEGAQDLRSQSRTWLIARKGNVPVDDIIVALITMTDRRERVTISYGPLEAGVWRMKVESVNVQRRAYGTNEVVRAEVKVRFDQVNDPTGPAPKAPAPTAGGAAAAATTGAPARTHVVARGDTLYALAVRFYGRGADWPRIADRNGVRDPKRLAVGQKLVIP